MVALARCWKTFNLGGLIIATLKVSHQGQRTKSVMRYLAIGDIHGCSQALEQLLAVVQPQP